MTPERSRDDPSHGRMVCAMNTTAAAHDAAQGRVRGLVRDEVMTAAEVSDLLHIPVSTVYYLARQGQLPHSRLGRTYRFLRPALEAMLAEGGR
jgi:excisionase family DNA binding protein